MSRALEILEQLNEVRTVKRRVIRGGKLMTVKKKIWTNVCGKGRKHNATGQCVPMSSKEKMALKRLQSSGAIKRRRMKSMAMRRRMINQDDSVNEVFGQNAAIVFDPEVCGDDLSGLIDDIHNALKDSDIDYTVDDPDTLPLEVYTDDFEGVAAALAPFEGVTLVELQDEEGGNTEDENEAEME